MGTVLTAVHDALHHDAHPPAQGPVSRADGAAGTRPPGRATDPQARLAAARAALSRAEMAAGLRTRLTRTHASPGGAGAPAGAPASGAGPHLMTSPALAAVAPVPPASPAPGPDGDPPDAAEGYLPVPGALAPLFPGGALARGSVVQVTGSTSVLLGLAGAASADGAWCALAALPDVGWRAAAAAGVALDRVAVVPRPGPDAAGVVGALVDGFDVLVVGRCPALGERDRRLIGARLRTRGAVLLSTHPWPGAQLVLRAAGQNWDGLGQGWGHLEEQELTVRATGRAGAARAREVRVHLGRGGLLAAAQGPLVTVADPPGARLLAPDAGSLTRAAAPPAAGPAAAAPDDAPLLQAV
ncbi:hypothetical protein [Georgenia sp. AZ-5]|uniref:hypothetical protein n=1 Tax=Georgenia sp. AZ-5 TaxID=3367526 RepID=UPI003754B849